MTSKESDMDIFFYIRCIKRAHLSFENFVRGKEMEKKQILQHCLIGINIKTAKSKIKKYKIGLFDHG